MIHFRTLFIVLFMFLVFQESDASLTYSLRKLITTHPSNTKLLQASHRSLQSPAPGPSPQLNTSGAHVSEETCDASVLFQCHDDINKVIACLPPAQDGSRGSTLLVRNNGGSNLRLNVTLMPANYTYNNAQIPSHQVQKIILSSNIRETTSIRVDIENGGCVIQLGSLAPLEKLYKEYATPVNGAYLLFGTLVLIGGVWACCRFRNNGQESRHLDGVPYQEIEMKQEKEPLPYVGTTDTWDESWDDDWDEENAVRSPGGNRPHS